MTWPFPPFPNPYDKPGQAPGQNMSKKDVINALRLAQDALHMATLPFPIDESKTRRALEAVSQVLSYITGDDDAPAPY